ncbi:MAG: hypothetical protein BWY70_00875 [Bacteroidetes bacterium ADurb.Bin408]|nr:MAG: hypothetical protein BWY70_00875 [Bacteroidetes bacterium ADurb.Bin408]
MKKFFAFTVLIMAMFIVSCHNSEVSKKIITERIQYDVLIKTPDADMDWWIQNIEGAKREELIKMILDKVYEGKIQAYDYLNKPMSAEEVKNIGKRNDTLLMPSIEPPYEDSVVIINESLKVSDITKLRFLEEWSIDQNTLIIEKRMLGLSLVKEDFDANGELRGYKPLFWIYFDKKYPIQE